MRHRLKSIIVTLALVLFAAGAIAKDLDNADILKLLKSGIGEDTVVLLIGSTPSHFDTSPESLVALKAAGASDKVMAAMISAGNRPPFPPLPAGAQYSVNPGQLAAAPMIPKGTQQWQIVLIDGETHHALQVANFAVRISAAAAFGLSRSAVAVIKPAHSDMVIANSSPQIEIRLDASQRVADAVLLVKFNSGASSRDIVVNPNVGTFLVPNRYVIPCTPKLVGEDSTGFSSTKLWRFIPNSPLVPGEYAVMWMNNFYDFTVRIAGVANP